VTSSSTNRKNITHAPKAHDFFLLERSCQQQLPGCSHRVACHSHCRHLNGASIYTLLTRRRRSKKFLGFGFLPPALPLQRPPPALRRVRRLRRLRRPASGGRRRRPRPSGGCRIALFSYSGLDSGSLRHLPAEVPLDLGFLMSRVVRNPAGPEATRRPSTRRCRPAGQLDGA
jgi:hypothetical protein